MGQRGKAATMTGGMAIVEALIANGVDTVFGLPGAQLYPLFDALQQRGDRIRTIGARHEQACGYMAFGYARSTGRPGVYAVVPGPGVLNTAAALCTALRLLRAGAVHHRAGAVGIPGARPRASARAARSARHPALADQMGGAHRAAGRRARRSSTRRSGRCCRGGRGRSPSRWPGTRWRRARSSSRSAAAAHPEAAAALAAGGGGRRQAARRRQAADDHDRQRRAACERGRARAGRGARRAGGGLPRRTRRRRRGPRARHLLLRRLPAVARDRRARRHRHAGRDALHALDRHDVADRPAAGAAAPHPHRHRSSRDAPAGAARRHRGGCGCRHARAAGGRAAPARPQGPAKSAAQGRERGARPHRRRQGRGARGVSRRCSRSSPISTSSARCCRATASSSPS